MRRPSRTAADRGHGLPGRCGSYRPARTPPQPPSRRRPSLEHRRCKVGTEEYIASDATAHGRSAVRRDVWGESMSVAIGLGLMEFPFDGAAGYWRWVDLCEEGGVDSLWQTD